MLDVEKIRNDFPIFNDLNKPFIYLDSASTSQKPLEVIPSSNSSSKTKSIKFYKPDPREEVKLVSPDNLDQLIDLLYNEAKVL